MGAVQQQLDRVRPGFPIQELYSWDWNRDPFVKGTWCSFQPGRTRNDLPALAASAGRIFFASADWANGWRGFMVGAIESGLRAARETAVILR